MLKVDWNLIHKLEGKGILKGYVPKHKDGSVMGTSGVTIASGVDLGAQGEEGLKKLVLSSNLHKKLLPYTKVKKQDAVELLKKQPLTITQEECNEITEKLQNSFLSQLMKMYDSASTVKFKDIPPPCQTVIMSVFYQYGNLPKRTPNFWKTVTSQNWVKMVSDLRNFGDAYDNRRNQEADYIVKNLK